ncbi:MAG: hypothetical protein K6B67_06615 [Lachnospiraceae bacterium]|nr:hypothetical protein [Lachnospiraceae bacterium]
MSITLLLFIGLIGAVGMFLGDMTLYFDRADYENDGTLNPVINIMKNVSTKRLYIGGILGPINSFVYCIGFYHLVVMVNDRYAILGWILFFINCFGIVCGGAYHSHCANLGLIGRHNDEKTMSEVIDYMAFQKKISFTLQAVGLLGVTLVILLGLTILPRWMAIFSPLVLVLLTPVMRKLPKGLHMVICGGWTNLIFVIYYVMAIICVGAM